MIPAHAPPHSFSELFRASVNRCLNRNVKSEFESAVCKAIGTYNYLTTSSGRRALFLSLKYAGVQRGDEIILPAFTTDIVPMVLREAGIVPVPADVREDDYNIDPESVIDRISDTTKAILVVHTYGCPADMKPLKDICQDKKLILIEDAAQAFGAKYYGIPVGMMGDFGIISYGIGKSISMGCGGGLIYQDSNLADKFRMIGKQKHKGSLGIFIKIAGSIVLKNSMMYGLAGGMVKDEIVKHQYDHYKDEVKDEDDIPVLSYAIGIQEINKGIIDARRQKALRYNSIVKNATGLYYQTDNRNIYNVYNRYFLRTDSEERRDQIAVKMKKAGIEVLTPDNGYPISPGICPGRWDDKAPVTDRLSKTLINIPLYMGMQESKLYDIIV